MFAQHKVSYESPHSTVLRRSAACSCLTFSLKTAAALTLQDLGDLETCNAIEKAVRSVVRAANERRCVKRDVLNGSASDASHNSAKVS